MDRAVRPAQLRSEFTQNLSGSIKNSTPWILIQELLEGWGRQQTIHSREIPSRIPHGICFLRIGDLTGGMETRPVSGGIESGTTTSVSGTTPRVSGGVTAGTGATFEESFGGGSGRVQEKPASPPPPASPLSLIHI